MTLGMPRLPETWSNEQVLGFVRLMWQQWLFKSGRGNPQDISSVAKGPAPPAAVAAAAKIAFTALGSNPEQIFFSEEYSRPVTEASPIDPASAALMERTNSGTLTSPELVESSEGDLHEWFEGDKQTQSGCNGQSSALIRSPLEDPEKRNRNLQWLRLHFRSLSQIGRLPFNHADLWQLHQYYFSPPVTNAEDEGGGNDSDSVGNTKSRAKSASPSTNPGDDMIGRSVSFRSLNEASALCASHVDHSSPTFLKRTHDDTEESQEPAAKKAKSLKPRVAFYPRVMVSPVISCGSICKRKWLTLFFRSPRSKRLVQSQLSRCLVYYASLNTPKTLCSEVTTHTMKVFALQISEATLKWSLWTYFELSYSYPVNKIPICKITHK